MLLLLAGKRSPDATAVGPFNQTGELHLRVECTQLRKHALADIEHRLPGEKAGVVADLEQLNEFSGGDINGIIVWRKDGNVDFYDVDGKRVKTEGGEDPPAPKRSMKDHGMPSADIVLINGNPKIASINGTRYILDEGLGAKQVGR